MNTSRDLLAAHLLLALLAITSSGFAQDPAGAPAASPPQSTAAPLVLASNAVSCPDSNRPPLIRRLEPARYEQRTAVAAIGRPLKLSVDVEDPDGTPLRVSALGLPEGAQFSEELRTLSWTPSATQRGEHPLRFVVSDGCKEHSRSLTLLVGENRAPFFERTAPRTSFKGEAAQVSLAAIDPDGDSLTYTVDGLWGDAAFDPRSATLTYKPDEDAGGKHSVRVTASDGALSSSQRFAIEQPPPQVHHPGDNWSSILLPGVGYTIYSPREREVWGDFHGVAVELVLSAWIHRNDNRGPSHGRVYVNAEVMQSSKSGVPLLFSYALGFSLSFERNPQRTWLIPTYGLDLGGLIHDGIGGRLQATPHIGLNLYSNRNVFIGARGGYRLVPSDVERFGGWHAGIGGDFSVW